MLLILARIASRYLARELETLPDECKALRSPGRYRVSTSSRLSRLHAQTVEEARGREGLA